MDIQIQYGANTKLTESELKDIASLAKEYGQLSVKKWERRSGAIDIVTSLEIAFALSPCFGCRGC